MEDEESLHKVFIELSKLKKKLASIEQQKRMLKKEKFVSKIQEKLERFSNVIRTINDYQERINNKKTSIVFKMPEKSLCANSNSLQLAHTHHDDFINITLSKSKIEELIHDQQSREDRSTDLKFIINELENTNATWRTQFFEQLCEYRSAKGLLDNIKQLKAIDKSNQDEESVYEKTDSDLGCYPNDSTTEENSPTIQFTTSSPISNKKLDFIDQ